MTEPDPSRHVDFDVANQVATAMGRPDRSVRLAGPIAYLRRDTTEPNPRHLETLTLPEPAVFPLPLHRDGTGLPVGRLVSATIRDGDVVWVEAAMETTDPPGTRYPVAMDVARAVIVHTDPATGAELPADIMEHSTRPVRSLFRSAVLLSATILDTSPAAWPDAYLEVIGPC